VEVADLSALTHEPVVFATLVVMDMRWLLLLLLAAAYPAAQAPREPLSPANAERARAVMAKLHSTDPQTRAWGAYEAGAFLVRDAVPALEAMLDGTVPKADERERWALADIALDSLIQLKARVPASLLARYARERPVQTHVLLANALDRSSVLLELLNKAKGLEWYSAANILLEDKSSGLAIHLLRNVRLHLTISVSEAGNRSSIGGSGMSSMSIGVGDGVGQSPAGFPPHVGYRFEVGMRPGFVILAPGPRPVLYSRAVHTTVQFPVNTLHHGGPSDDDRLAYLQAMVGADMLPVMRAHTGETARWTTAAGLLERVDESRRILEAQFDRLRARVEASYKVPRDTSRVPITVTVVDLREDRSVPLPAVPK
jgi:hypothetical protein